MDNGAQALYLLLYGSPVPQKLFGNMQEEDIEDALASLELSVAPCKYKQTRSYVLVNNGEAIDQPYTRAFKIMRAILHLEESMQREDLIEVLEDNVRVSDDFSWEEFIVYCQEREFIDVEEVNSAIQKVEISELGKIMMSDEAVEKFLEDLGFDNQV